MLLLLLLLLTDCTLSMRVCSQLILMHIVRYIDSLHVSNLQSDRQTDREQCVSYFFFFLFFPLWPARCFIVAVVVKFMASSPFEQWQFVVVDSRMTMAATWTELRLCLPDWLNDWLSQYLSLFDDCDIICELPKWFTMAHGTLCKFAKSLPGVGRSVGRSACLAHRFQRRLQTLAHCLSVCLFRPLPWMSIISKSNFAQ